MEKRIEELVISKKEMNIEERIVEKFGKKSKGDLKLKIKRNRVVRNRKIGLEKEFDLVEKERRIIEVKIGRRIENMILKILEMGGKIVENNRELLGKEGNIGEKMVELIERIENIRDVFIKGRRSDEMRIVVGMMILEEEISLVDREMNREGNVIRIEN